MSKNKRILSISNEPNLAASRALALGNAGHQVTSAAGRTHGEQAIAGGEFDVLVLCHTLASEEAIALTHAFRKVNPSAKVLAVATGWFIVVRADRVVQMTDGPFALLSAIHDLDDDLDD
ncbi:MAG: hypothetical protein M3P27_04290 [Acidobacteriota bacterium]|nr:hypothetical protein [Acidobacteriota bacterium]